MKRARLHGGIVGDLCVGGDSRKEAMRPKHPTKAKERDSVEETGAFGGALAFLGFLNSNKIGFFLVSS